MPTTVDVGPFPIKAPLERVFALSTCIPVVGRTLGMALISGPASGFIQPGSRVHWRGWKFGMTTDHHTIITAFEPPRHIVGEDTAFFQDSQEQGRFQTFHHDHHFRQPTISVFTLVRDHVEFSLPWWLGGSAAESTLLAPYIRRLAEQRFRLLKRIAESEEWREFLPS